MLSSPVLLSRTSGTNREFSFFVCHVSSFHCTVCVQVLWTLEKQLMCMVSVTSEKYGKKLFPQLTPLLYLSVFVVIIWSTVG